MRIDKIFRAIKWLFDFTKLIQIVIKMTSYLRAYSQRTIYGTINMKGKGQQLLPNQRTTPIITQNGGEGERAPFLAEPVRLTPAWEASNLPNDELNFKGMTMERAKMEISPPHDRFKLVFLTLVLHGLGVLMPWNMFITAKEYFTEFKLHESYTGVKSTAYSTNFLPYVGFAAQIPNLVFNWLNVFIRVGGNLTTRIFWSILFVIVIFLVTVILAMTDTSAWPGAFFWVTMVSAALINMANGIYQNTVYGIAAKLPYKYTGAVVLGSNICGVFATIISMASSAIASSYRTAAIYYFITAILVLLICFDTYFALPLNKFYRYHELLNEREAEKNKKLGDDVPPYWTIFKQCFVQLFNVFFVFFVTVTVFPAVHSDIKLKNDNFPIPEKLYTQVTCFLTFNLFAMLGSLLTSWVTWPKPKYLIWPVVVRVVFIPLFIFCNYQPKDIIRQLPIYINNDWVYWIIAVIMSFSSGYLSSLAMMYTPQTVTQKYAVTAGMFAAAMMITGIVSGILFSMVFPQFVENVGW